MNRHDSAKARAQLQTSTYDLATEGLLGIVNNSMLQVFVRGQAYLASHQAREPAAEFQKILDHPGIVQNSPIGALAHLGLARARVLQGDTLQAKSAYESFLNLWHKADPDIPLLLQAKAEYAKLR